MMPTTLVITPGDPDGIGPEVTAKALHQLSSRLKKIDVLVFGARKPFRKYDALLKKIRINFFEPPARSSPGYQSGWAIETATQFVMAAPKSRFLVTGPISKERLQEGGYFYQGHTDFLADLTRAQHVTMMLANEIFRVALVTNHCALKDVSTLLTAEKLFKTLENAYDYSQKQLGKRRPKIAVLGLNPHSGENGMMGVEEKTILIPTLKKFKAKHPNLSLTGPHPADSFFAIEASKKQNQRHDVIIAMYHDQGLIPVKLSDFSNSLNMTLGLPIVRTSVDHGTAFDIAKKNVADASSMVYAIKKALEYGQLLQKK